MAEECVCTVCEMPVTMEKMELKREYKGRVYYFCSGKCKESFEKSPDEYCVRWSGKVPG